MGTTNPRRAVPARSAWSCILSLATLLALYSAPPARSESAPVRIHVDGRTLQVNAPAGSVREALHAAGITVGSDDEVTPRADGPIVPGADVHVRRVSFVENTVDLKIPYRTTVRPASKGQNPYHPTVIREGRNGLKRVSYRAKIVDGREVQRTTVSEEVVREPVQEVVVSRRPYQLGSRGAYGGKRTFFMLATAYDPGPGSCGKYADGKTCNGKRAGYGVIAVDPRIIPLGTKLHVPGYGYGIAADVGGAIKGSRIDLGYNSRSGARQWGKKWVHVTVVD